VNPAHALVAVLHQNGDSTLVREEYIMSDAFQGLVQADGLARVSTTYQRALKYGEEKVVVTITVACDQNEAQINEAGKLTFLKALELTDDNFHLLDEASKAAADKVG
jgi:hypothetical protein